MRRIGSGLRTRATVARWSAWAWVVLLSSCFTLKPQEKTRLLERRLEAAEVHGKKDPLRLASALNSLGLDRIQAGAYREAHELLAEALEIRQRELHPDHPFTAATRNILGWVLTEEGDYEHALPMLEQALRVNEKKLGKYHVATAATLINLAKLCDLIGDQDRAFELYERALSIENKFPWGQHTEKASILNGLGMLCASEGRYEEAIELYGRALEHMESAGSSDNSFLLINLADVLLSEGRHDDARPLIERALEVREKRFGPDSADALVALGWMAGLLHVEGRLEQARELYQETLDREECALGSGHPCTAGTLNGLGNVLTKQGEFEKAEAALRRALSINEDKFGPEHPYTAATLNRLGWVLCCQNRYGEAQLIDERALGISEHVLGRNNPNTTACLYALAHLQLDQGNESGAVAYASRSFAAAQGQLVRMLPALTEKNRLVYAQQCADNLEILLATSPAEAPAVARDAYDALLSMKGIVSRSLSCSTERARNGLDQRGRKLLEDLKKVQAALSNHSSPRNGVEGQVSEKRMAELVRTREELELELEKRRDRDTEGTVTASDLASVSPANSALIDFYLHAEHSLPQHAPELGNGSSHWSKPVVTAWVLKPTGDGPVQIELGPADLIEKAIERHLKHIQAERSRSMEGRNPDVFVAETRSSFEHANEELRRVLWDPLVKEIGDAELVIVSPDQFLGTLPFETLREEDGSYLIEHRKFVYLQDMASLADLARDRAPRDAPGQGDFLVMGGVDYGTLSDESRGASASGRREFETFANRERRNSWRPLRFAEQEARALSILHRGLPSQGTGSQLLSSAAATEVKLKAALPGKRYIHLATHGYFLPDSTGMSNQGGSMDPLSCAGDEGRRVRTLPPGLLSGVVCAGANAPAIGTDDDGLLTAEEVTWLDLSSCELVTLSACQTGVGTSRSGEGMLGLRRSFRLAGAKTVVSALWSVDDAATSDLMQSFYRRLWLEKQSKSDALRGAQLELLNKNRARYGNAVPFTWGAFVLDGDWR